MHVQTDIYIHTTINRIGYDNSLETHDHEGNTQAILHPYKYSKIVLPSDSYIYATCRAVIHRISYDN